MPTLGLAARWPHPIAQEARQKSIPNRESGSNHCHWGIGYHEAGGRALSQAGCAHAIGQVPMRPQCTPRMGHSEGLHWL